MLPYDVVDVFTDRAFAGNPLAVVREAGGLSGGQLQAVAAEFNLAETAFPLEPTGADRARGADYRLRIFTPSTEIPFAGHPSIGSAWVLHRDGSVPAGQIRQACGAGLVTLGVTADEGSVELSAEPRGVSPASSAEPVLDAVGLDPSDALTRLRMAGCGLDFAYVQVRTEALPRAQPSPRALATVPPRPGGGPLGGLCLYCVAVGTTPLQVTARVFCPEVGVPEDPATGSAALGMGLVLHADGLLASQPAYHVYQGAEMGRPSLLRGRVSRQDGQVKLCHVTGSVVPVASGRIAIPAER